LGHHRIAVIGCGAAGRMHVEAIVRSGDRPTVLIDPDPNQRAELVRLCPEAITASTPAQVGDAFDVAVVAAPDLHHRDLTVALLEAGKDLLVEKPMAPNRTEARAMVDAADRSGRVLAVAHVRRHLSVKAWAFDLLGSGALGAVKSVDVAQGGRNDWLAATSDYVEQAAGGVIADQGSHSLDLLTWWFGPMDVVACSDDARGGHEANASLDLVAGSVPIHVELSRISAKRNTIKVEAERGVLEVSLDHYQHRQLVASPTGVDAPPFEEVVQDLAGQFDRQWAAFKSALDGRWPSTLATGPDGAAIAAILEDCYEVRTTQEVWWMRSATERR